MKRSTFSPRLALLAAPLLSLLVLLAASPSANAAARTASVTGAWNVTGTWGGLSVPGSADAVTVNAGITVTVPSGYAAQCTTINFTTSSGAASIVLADNTASLTASGAVTIQRNGNLANAINAGAGAFSALSVALSGTTGGTRLAQILISTGTVTVSGNITSQGVASQIVFSDAGTLNVGGTFLSGTAGTLTPATGTVNFNLAGAQTVGAYTYNNLTLSGSGVKTTTGVTVNGKLSRQGTATVSVVPIYGATSSLEYKGSAAQTTGVELASPMVHPVVIDNALGVTRSAAGILNSNLTLVSGAFTITSGLTLGNGVTVTRAGGSLAAAPTFGATVNVAYSGATGVTAGNELPATITVLSNLTVSYSSAAALTLNAARTVNGTLTISANNTLADGGYTLTANGTVANAGTHSGAGKVLLAGTSAQALSGIGSYGNLELTNAAGATLGAATTVNGTLTLTIGALANGANLTLADGITISRAVGSLGSAPTFGASVNVSYTGASGVTAGNELPASATVLNNLTVNNSGGVTPPELFTVRLF
ncbi:MAG: hypothetical protein WCL11_14890, partial [Verrucomicrobiota bacterium]